MKSFIPIADPPTFEDIDGLFAPSSTIVRSSRLLQVSCAFSSVTADDNAIKGNLTGKIANLE